MTPEDGLDNNFRYVVMAARRARQLQNGSQPLIDSRSTKACRVAQEEIAAGKVKAAQPKRRRWRRSPWNRSTISNPRATLRPFCDRGSTRPGAGKVMRLAFFVSV